MSDLAMSYQTPSSKSKSTYHDDTSQSAQGREQQDAHYYPLCRLMS